jgi:hypothetical protein
LGRPAPKIPTRYRTGVINTGHPTGDRRLDLPHFCLDWSFTGWLGCSVASHRASAAHRTAGDRPAGGKNPCLPAPVTVGKHARPRLAGSGHRRSEIGPRRDPLFQGLGRWRVSRVWGFGFCVIALLMGDLIRGFTRVRNIHRIWAAWAKVQQPRPPKLRLGRHLTLFLVVVVVVDR